MIFGKIKEQDVLVFQLKNEHIQAKILSYGGIIQELSLYNGHEWENVIFAYDNIGDYLDHSPYFGAITGRTAGRIKGAKFTLNKKDYELEKNNATNNIHGGIHGLDKKIWECKSHTESELILTYFSPDGENGFPANVELQVRYWIEGTSFFWELEALSDEDTPINVTNHTYFNLSSGKDSALNHELILPAHYFYPVSSTNEISGEKITVSGTAFDFRKRKKISQDIEFNDEQLAKGQGYDHCFLLDDSHDPIDLYDPITKKGVQIYTNQKACVFYSGNFLNEKLGRTTLCPIKRRSAVCLETQNVPDGIEGIILKKGEKYLTKNEWRFYQK